MKKLALVVVLLACGFARAQAAPPTACDAERASVEQWSIEEQVAKHSHDAPRAIRAMTALGHARTALSDCEARARAARQDEINRAALAAAQRETALQAERRAADDRERARIAEAQETHRRLTETHAGDPRYYVPSASAAICLSTKARAAAKAEIATELRYAKEGGRVVNKQDIHDQQDAMREADEQNASYRKRLRGAHQRELPCSDRLVRLLMHCHEDRDGSECATDEVKDRLELLND